MRDSGRHGAAVHTSAARGTAARAWRGQPGVLVDSTPHNARLPPCFCFLEVLSLALLIPLMWPYCCWLTRRTHGSKQRG